MPKEIDDLLSRWKPALGLDFTEGNQVDAFVQGDPSQVSAGSSGLAAMYEAMETAENSSHFIYLLGWFLDDRLPLLYPKPDAKSSIGKLFLIKAAQHVQMRVILWWQPFKGQGELTDALKRSAPPELVTTLVRPLGGDGQRSHADIIEDINKLPTGAGFVDWWTASLAGCHHQKLLVVKGRNGLIGFCGGLDINPDRVMQVRKDQGEPLHDVHCRITGPAARDLVDVFVQRWESNPASQELEQKHKKAKLIGKAEPPGNSKGDAFVRIVSTFNRVTNDTVLPAVGTAVAAAQIALHETILSKLGIEEMAGAPVGNVLLRARRPSCKLERSVRESLLGAIETASNYIYFEDQYLVGPDELIKALLKALSGKVKRVIALVSSSKISDMPRINEMRDRFIGRLLAGKGREKFELYYLIDPVRRAYGPYTYVHAKTWIFDDELAFIGSANVNNRGWSSDSEVGACILDIPASGVRGRLPFAQRLRMTLWSQHLGVREEELADWNAAADLWQKPSPTSRVRSYLNAPDRGQDPASTKALPFELIDPNVDDFDFCRMGFQRQRLRELGRFRAG